MDGKWRFSLQHLFGIVIVFAVALGLTRYFLSLLPSPDLYPPSVVCFLFLESAIAVYCWGVFVGDLFGPTADNDRWRNFGSAVFTLILLLVSYSMLLPA